MSRLAIAAASAAILMGGCAFVPQAYHRIDEVKAAHSATLAEGQVPALAPSEWARASEALAAAVTARGTLQDPAVVDHLAYLAKQRIEIARETARRVAAEGAIENAARAPGARRVSLSR